MPPIQTDLISGKEVLLHPPSSGGSAPSPSPLTDIEVLTGTSGSVSPGGFYDLMTSGAFTLGIQGAVEGKGGCAIIDIVLGTGGSVTGGTGLEIKSELKTGKLNRCFVVFKNSTAELWAWTDRDAV